METDGYQYDLFVSYSHADEAWVTEELLPRLDAWSVNTCIDRRSFQAGQRLVSDELVRLLRLSRQALIVLTRSWLASNFTDLEMQHLLSTAEDDEIARVLPLRLDSEEVPVLLQAFQMIDAPFLGWPKAWGALRRALIAARPNRIVTNLAVEVDLSRCSADRRENGFDYEAALLVANINPVVDCTFDSIDTVFSVRDIDRSFAGHAQAMRIAHRGERLAQYYSYHGPMYFGSFRGLDTDDGSASMITLKPHTALKLPPLRLSHTPDSAAGKVAVRMTVHLSLAGIEVAERCWCMLPPLLRLPESDTDSKPMHLKFIAARLLPTPSGIFQADIGNTALTTASAFDPDALLVSVQPSLVTEVDFSDDDMLHTCIGWRYFFFSNKLGGLFKIDSADPEWMNPDDIERNHEKPRCWLTQAMLDLCRIDCADAYLIAREAGARPMKLPFLSLTAMVIDGRWRPLWLLPLKLGDSPVVVSADSCELFIAEGQHFRKADGVIWNN